VPVLAGHELTAVEIRDGRLTAPADPDAVAHDLLGAVVTGVGRRGKYLTIELDDGRTLVSHLRMTGWYHHVPEPVERPHLRALFGLDDGSWVLYSDQRRFGTMRLVEAGGLKEFWRGRVGPEPLDGTWTPQMLRAAMRKRLAPVKALLLDQKVVAGLGNIYASEALHHARLSPLRKAATIATVSGAPRKTAEQLAKSIKAVLTSAIRRRESPYRSARFQVYEREGKPCPRKGCGGTIRRIQQAGRSTFYCHNCQK